MTDKELKNLAKAAFPEQDTSYNAAYWDKMEAMLDQKAGKRRGAFWWWTGGLGVLVLALAGFWFGNNSNIENQKELIAEANAAKTTAISKNSKPSEASPNDLATPESKVPKQNSNATIENELISDSKSIEIIDNTTPFASSDSKSNSNEIDTKSQDVIATSASMQSEENHFSNVVHNSNNDGLAVGVVSTSVSEEIRGNGGNEESLHQDNEELTKGQTAVHKSEEGNTFNATSEKLHTLNLLGIKFPKYPPSQITSISFSQPTELNTPPNEFNGEREKVKPNYFVEGQFTVQQSGKVQSFVVNDVEKPKDYTTVSPQSLQSFSGGVIGGVQWNKVFVYSGLYFNQVQQSFQEVRLREISKEELEIVDREVLSKVDSTFIGHTIKRVPNGSGFNFEYAGSNYDVDSQFVTVTDTNKLYSYEKVEEKSSYKYQINYIQLPLAVGIEHNFKSNWLVEATLVGQIGFKVGNSVTSTDASTNSVAIPKVDEVFSPMQFNTQVLLGVGYRFTPQLSLRVRPQFQYSVIGLYKDAKLNEQYTKPMWFGGNIGLRYRF
jgi:hypothetical protein